MAEKLTLELFFEQCRHDPTIHLGLGDIRLTMGDQELVVYIEEMLRRKIARQAEQITKLEQSRKDLREQLKMFRQGYWIEADTEEEGVTVLAFPHEFVPFGVVGGSAKQCKHCGLYVSDVVQEMAFQGEECYARRKNAGDDWK